MNTLLIVTSALQLIATDLHARRHDAPPAPPVTTPAPPDLKEHASCRKRQYFVDILKKAGRVQEQRLSEATTNFARGVYAQLPPEESIDVTDGVAYLTYVEDQGGIVGFYGDDECAKTTMILKPKQVSLLLSYKGHADGTAHADPTPKPESQSAPRPMESGKPESKPDWY